MYTKTKTKTEKKFTQMGEHFSIKSIFVKKKIKIINCTVQEFNMATRSN
jgi:hypothetical protein